jgi:lipopolysaccharide biosynthesis regulator YciM
MGPYLTLFVLLALLAGLTVGKAWERYKLQDGRWIDRRRARESPHYMLGLNFLVANQIDPAIEELSTAAEAAGDPLEIHLILGNLYREKGQVGRAIQEHQQLLQRPHLRKLEHANVLLCLGLDYKHGGFVDRALEAFTEVLRLDPQNRYAMSNLEKLHEEQHQWTDAYAMRQKLAARDKPEQQARHHEILAFLENEIGLAALKRHDYSDAIRRFEAAIELDAKNAPAYLNLGDVRLAQDDAHGALDVWTRLVNTSPERAYLTFSRFESVYARINDNAGFPALCRRLIGSGTQDWRARLALARHLTAHRQAAEGLELLFETGHDHDFDRVVVAACDPHQQLTRLMSRDRLSEAEARARLNAQWPIEEKVARASYVIRTDGTLADTDAQVRTIYQLLIADC